LTSIQLTAVHVQLVELLNKIKYYKCDFLTRTLVRTDKAHLQTSMLII